MATLNNDQILDAIEQSRWNELIDQLESQELEFKREPYRLDSAKEKFELAKDISGMANAGGGIIILGVATKKNPHADEEIAAEIQPFPQSEFDPRRIGHVARDQTVPKIAVSARFFPSESDPTRGIGVIEVGEVDERLKPAIVRVAQLEVGGNPSDRAIGVFIRQGTNTYNYDAPYLQELLRRGRSVAEDMTQARARTEFIVEGATATAKEQLARDVEALNPDTPYLVFQAYPLVDFRLAWLQTASRAEIDDRFVRPQQARTQGFNLDFDSLAESLPAGGLRKVRTGGISMSLLPSGLLTVTVGYEFLGWAMQERNHPEGTVNTIALCEIIYEACEYYAREIGVSASRSLVSIVGSERGVPHLFPGALGDWFLGEPQTPTGNRHSLHIHRDGEFADPRKVSAELIQALFLEFGIRGDDVPYIRDGGFDIEMLSRDGP